MSKRVVFLWANRKELCNESYFKGANERSKVERACIKWKKCACFQWSPLSSKTLLLLPNRYKPLSDHWIRWGR